MRRLPARLLLLAFALLLWSTTADAAFKSAGSATGTGSPASVTWPSVAANDIIIVAWTFDTGSAGSITYSDTITTFGVDQVTGGSSDKQSSGIAWKRVAGTESGSLTVSGSGVTSGVQWVIGYVLYDGRATGSDPTATGNKTDTPASSPVTATATGVTASAGDDLCWAGAPDPGTSGATNVWTDPTSFTVEVNTENGFADLYMGKRDNVSAGATGNIDGTFSLTSGTASWMAYLVRIPTAGGGGFTAKQRKTLTPTGSHVGGRTMRGD